MNARSLSLLLVSVLLAALGAWRLAEPPAPLAELPAAKPVEHPVSGLHARVLGPDGLPAAGVEVLVAPAGVWDGLALDVPLVAQSRDETSQTRHTWTDAQGRFFLTREAADYLSHQVHVALRMRGAAPFEDEALRLPPRDAQGRMELGDLQLALGAQISGRVLDASGAPLAGARLSWARPGAEFTEARRQRLVATTAADGHYAISALEPGNWSLVVRHPAHPYALFRGEALAAGSELQLDLTLEAGVSIQGKVVDPRLFDTSTLLVSVEPLGPRCLGDLESGARLYPVATDGSFAATGLDPLGRFALRAVEGTAAWDSWPRGACSPQVQARPGESVELRRSWGALLAFRPVDALTREDVYDFRLVLQFPDGSREVHEARDLGRWEGFWFHRSAGRPQAAGQPTAVLHADGYREQRFELNSWSEGDSVQLGTLGLEPLPTLRVRVLRLEDDSPITAATALVQSVLSPGQGSKPAGFGLWVRAEGPDARLDEQRLRTDAKGWVDLPLESSAPGSRRRLCAWAPGFAPSHPLDLPEDDALLPEEIELRLTRGGLVQLQPPAVGLLGVWGAELRLEVDQRWADEPESCTWPRPAQNRSLSLGQALRLFPLGAGTHRFRWQAWVLHEGQELLLARGPWCDVSLGEGEQVQLRLPD